MEEGKENFEQKIVGFTCNWCTYAGADYKEEELEELLR